MLLEVAEPELTGLRMVWIGRSWIGPSWIGRSWIGPSWIGPSWIGPSHESATLGRLRISPGCAVVSHCQQTKTWSSVLPHPA